MDAKPITPRIVVVSAVKTGIGGPMVSAIPVVTYIAMFAKTISQLVRNALPIMDYLHQLALAVPNLCV